MTKMILAAALALLPLASPALAEAPRAQNVNDRIADLCAASDVDLVGKRLAKDCRAAVRAAYQEEQRLAAVKTSPDATIKVAERK